VAKTPFLYRKIMELAKSLDTVNKNYEMARDDFNREVSSRFRISQKDMPRIEQELRRYEQLERQSQRRIRIRP
jgi:superfamily I DNA and RNA helicase